jgi:2-polyprenyl-3-methyl-5-hydroxy-6-metoxy-1,4-benzoquinol methylase
MIDQTTVEAAYRLILGREPESDAVVAGHRSHPSVAALRRTLLTSREFSRLYTDLARTAPVANGVQLPTLMPAGAIETDTTGAQRDALWARVAAAWTGMGETAAHWSVLTQENYRPEAIESHREEFIRTGNAEGALVDAALQRCPGVEPGRMTCLEVGCGVGRATRALADCFAHVTGVDVSGNHLRIAEAELAQTGHRNVTLRHVGSMADYDTLPAVDVFFSRIVLQHNPPPVQASILRAVLGLLNPGGVAIFQVVTAAQDYAYSVAADLNGAKGRMEMHVLPQPVVFALLAEAGLHPLEVQEDFAAGRDTPYRSHLFVARKDT